MRPSLAQLRRLLNSGERTLLDAARTEAEQAGTGLWLVGGAVRDLALGRPVHDLDLAVAGDAHRFALAVAARLPRSSGRAPEVEHEPRFGTASLRLREAGVEGARLDLARLRRERYPAPGALPEVTFVADAEAAIEVDLARRDFTVNAMALALVGARRKLLVDPFGGLEDLAARRLRVLHPRSFIDDATRLWRGARTAAVFDLAPDADTARLIAEGGRWLAAISGDRIMAELTFTAHRVRSGRTLALAEAWGVLHATHPALRLDPATARALRHRPDAIPIEVFVALIVAPLRARRAILDRLAASRSVATVVEQTARLLAAPVASDPAAAPPTPEDLARLAGPSAEARRAALWLDPERQPLLQRALARWERTRSPLDAHALMRLGVPRGPALGAALHGLRRARYLGTLSAPAAARAAVRAGHPDLMVKTTS